METSSQISTVTKGKWEGRTNYPSQWHATNYPMYRITEVISCDQRKAGLSPMSYHAHHFFTSQSSFLQFLREHRWPEYHSPAVQVDTDVEWETIDPRTALQMYDSYELEEDSSVLLYYVREYEKIERDSPAGQFNLRQSFRYLWDRNHDISARYSPLFALILENEFVRYNCIQCEIPDGLSLFLSDSFLLDVSDDENESNA